MTLEEKGGKRDRKKNREDLIGKATETLEAYWSEILKIETEDIEKYTFVEDPAIEKNIRLLVNANTKAFRYAVLTQIVAKVVVPDLNCLALQKRANVKGAFDARSFCKKVVVPFEIRFLKHVLGGSPDPYVSKPLRRPIISFSSSAEIKYSEEWKSLVSLLNIVEEQKSSNFAEQILKQILLEIRKLILQLPLQVPDKVSTEQIKRILVEYLSRSTLGLGPQAIAYSIFEIFRGRTNVYHTVLSSSPTTADAFSGHVADIECRDEEGNLRLAVCVTQRLDLEKFHNETRKCKGKGVSNVLFLASEIILDTHHAYKMAFEQGLNIAICDIVNFAILITTLLNNKMRKELIQKIADTVYKWGGTSEKRRFNEIVNKLLQSIVE